QLVGSNPADKASVDAGPSQLELTFDQPVQGGENINSIVVLVPKDDSQWQEGTATVRGNIVSIAMRELGPAGDYRVGYRILSADGHPVSGELKFTLTKDGNGTPAPPKAQQPSSNTTAGASGDSGGVPIWVWIVGAVVLLGAGVFLALRMGGGTAK
nr:copper resistance protein CopC [Actinomycetota bacterium]